MVVQEDEETFDLTDEEVESLTASIPELDEEKWITAEALLALAFEKSVYDG